MDFDRAGIRFFACVHKVLECITLRNFYIAQINGYFQQKHDHSLPSLVYKALLWRANLIKDTGLHILQYTTLNMNLHVDGGLCIP